MDLHSLLSFRFSRRVPSVLQTEAAECGLACLVMVASYYGYDTDLPTMRSQFSFSLRGMTLTDLIQVANACRLTSRPLRVELEGLKYIRQPCILHWDLNHFVVLAQVNPKGVVIHDPAIGIRTLTWAEMSDHFTGVALELVPAADFQPKKSKQTIRLTDLIGRVIGLKRSLLQIFALALALEVLTIVAPLGTQWVVDGVVVTGDLNLLVLVVIGLGLLLATQVAITAARAWAVVYLSTSMQLQWVANLFSHLLRLPADYFERRHIGDITSRFGSTNTIRTTLTSSFIEALLDGLMAIGTVTMMLVYSRTLALVSLAAVVLFVGLRIAFYRPLLAASGEEIVQSAREQTNFFENIRGVQSIKLYNAEDERRSRWLSLVVNTTNRRLVRERITLLSQAAQTAIFGLEAIVVLYLSAHLIIENTFSVGMFFAYATYRTQFSERIGALVNKLFELRMLELHIERLSDIVLTECEQGLDTEVAREDWWSSQHQVGIELKNIRFRYSESEPWVLDGVNLVIAPGESVAIVGPSGCGKTTLAKLMLGLLKPHQGEILIGGVALRQLGLRTYRSGIAAVMQDDNLFSGSITQNIAFFASNIDMDWIIECAQRAGIHQEIQAMPMRYESLVGDIGTGLSGGQKQRVLLARSLYKKPHILFLDEATSHLDVARERLVNHGIQELDITRVIIAHRPETIAMADRVIHLEHGRVIADSPRIPGGAIV